MTPDEIKAPNVRCAECNCEHGGVYCNWFVSRPAEYRAEIARLTSALAEAQAQVAALRHTIHEASHPDFIWGALDNVYDAETTLDDYAAAASRAIRKAVAADAKAALAARDKAVRGKALREAAAVKIKTGRVPGETVGVPWVWRAAILSLIDRPQAQETVVAGSTASAEAILGRRGLGVVEVCPIAQESGHDC